MRAQKGTVPFDPKRVKKTKRPSIGIRARLLKRKPELHVQRAHKEEQNDEQTRAAGAAT